MCTVAPDVTVCAHDACLAHSLSSGGSIVNMLDLFNFTDPGESHAIDILSIDYDEFKRAMRQRCGYNGPNSVLHALFKTLDLDDSGHVDQHEMFECARSPMAQTSVLRPPA